MKKILSMFLAMVMIFAIVPISVSADTSGHYTYTVSNGEATITRVSASINGAVTIPDTLGGYPVTSIGNYAFAWCYDLTSVTIGNSVTSIGDDAFTYCRSLTSVTIPDSVTSIGNSAFSNCTSLTNISVSENNTAYKSIDGVLFTKNGETLVQYPIGKADTSYTIPDSVTTIGSYALWGCSSLTSVTIPDSVTSIGYMAFLACRSLTSVTIGNSVTSIGDYAFRSCTSLTNISVSKNNTAYKSIDGVLFTKNGETLVQYPIGKADTSYTIPDSVTSIGSEAFADCTSLTSVTIPDSVTSIGNSAFSDCTSLTIYCYENSYAHTYAMGYGIPYEIICNHTSTKLDGAKTSTCTATGYTGDTVCADCGDVIEKGSIIPATGHDLVYRNGKVPTCTESGYANYVTCNICDYTTYKALPATGHSIVNHSAKAATCTEIGWFAYETCEHCDYTTYVELRAYGHQYENNACIHCGEAKPVLPGDVNGNGVIDITDLSAFRRFFGGAVVTGFNETAADVDGDGEVKISDVSALARIITGAVI